MSNLKIVAELASPVAFAGFLTIEGPLSYAVMKEKLGDDYEHADDISQLTEVPIPVKKWEGLYKASCGFISGKETKVIYHKKWEEGYDDLVNFRGRREKITVGTGQFKSYSMPLKVYSTTKVVFFVDGDNREIERLLKYVPRLGKKASQGYGIVKKWRVEEIEKDLSVLIRIETDTSTMIRAMRAIPVEIAMRHDISGLVMFAACKNPFWNPENMTKCIVPEVNLERDPEEVFL